jgi:hypothetical protein
MIFSIGEGIGDHLFLYLSDRHLSLDLPTLDALKKRVAGKTTKRIAEGKKPFEGLSGCLKNSKTFEGNPAEIIRVMRDEW